MSENVSILPKVYNYAIRECHSVNVRQLAAGNIHIYSLNFPNSLGYTEC